MKRTNFFKFKDLHKIYLPDLLRPSDVQRILQVLNISWPDKLVKSIGWVTIRSPFREDRNPSFSLNIYKGCFSDHAHPECKGDIVSLVMLAKGYNRRTAEKWIAKTINLESNISLFL